MGKVGRPTIGDSAMRGFITIPLARADLDRLAMEAEKNGTKRVTFGRMLLLAALAEKEKADG